jgi:hypothetical protein
VTMTASATPPAWLNDSAPGDNSASTTATVTGGVQPTDCACS